MSRTQPSRALAAIAVALVAGSVFARQPAVLAAVCGTLAALVAVAATGWAARRATGAERRAWEWIAAGCAGHLLGRVVCGYEQIGLRVRPPFPSFADRD